MKLIAILPFVIFLLLPCPSRSTDIYKWKDEDGTIHLTDDYSTIPKNRREEAEKIETVEDAGSKNEKADQSQTENSTSLSKTRESMLEEKIRDDLLKEFWGNRALEIEQKEEAIVNQIQITERNLRAKKREVDYLLINGYFADRSIYELRYLENYLKDLNRQLNLVEIENRRLKEQARRKGIPPGYLRP